MGFSLFRDGGDWSAYECAVRGVGEFATQAAVEAKLRQLQEQDLVSARADLAIAKQRVKEAEAALVAPAPIRMLDERRAKEGT